MAPHTRFLTVPGRLPSPNPRSLNQTALHTAPDDRFRALVAARPGREQAMASQLMFQQTGFARASRDLLEPGPREPDFEGFVRDADIAKRIRVIVTLRQGRQPTSNSRKMGAEAGQ